MKTLSLIISLTIFSFNSLFAQLPLSDNVPGITPPFITEQQYEQPAFYPSITKKPGHYTCEDWRHLIDSVWGPGLPTATKLQIFDQFWHTIDSAFACFHNLPLNWDSLRTLYRPEIEAGVSKGRFSAIMSHLALLLKESHTAAYDIGVAGTPRIPGIPIFNISGWLNSGPFGAGLTPLPDSSLLVYQVIANHPLGLQRGDIILGYDRIPWKVLYKQLIECELPIRLGTWVGCSPSAYIHSLLITAGRNWYLFDTIDVVKYSNGDTLHLSTAPLISQTVSAFNTEQMDIAGVPKPNYPTQVCSYGIVTGTNIGYIYGWAWTNNAQPEFFNAVQALMQTDGLIIDFRFNLGGNMFLSNPGLSLLFDSSVATIDFGIRCSPGNHQQMCPLNNSNVYVIPGAPPGYNKPIAVLTGPGAVSSGDQVALRMKYHRHARFFGKSTSAAFNAPVIITLHTDFYFGYARADAYKLSNPNAYLTHTELEVDTSVWLSRSLVSQGRDDVVEAALAWINSLIGITNLGSETPQRFSLAQNYPNPFNPTTKIQFALPKSSFATLVVYDILGREVTTLVNEQLKPGSYEVDWNASNFPSGIYFYSLFAGGASTTLSMTATKKMALIK